MATNAATRKARASSKSEPPTHSPQRWWQWMLVYPTFAIALVSAFPQWVDKAKAYSLGVRSASEAKKQAAMWVKNASCVGLNPNSYLSPEKKIAVNATICNSGDILVHATTPQKAEIFRWLALDDVVRSGGGNRGLIPAAEAATLSGRVQPIAPPAMQQAYKLALLQPGTVICTKSDGRLLLRRIQTPEGCFDEVIDTFTGALVSRRPAPCTPQC